MLDRGKTTAGIECQRSAFDYMSCKAAKAIRLGDATDKSAVSPDNDLVTCIEVAEHIEPSKSDALVDTITASAKEYVYFTADETPGRLHINARPHGWWVGAFAERGWAVDSDKTAKIRTALYDSPCNWLSQNSFVFRRECHA